MIPDLDKQVSYVIQKREGILSEEDAINHKIKELDARRKTLESMTAEIIKQMRHGDRLSDEIMDYCFFRWGFEFPEKMGKVKTFIERLNGYSGQLILENCAGYEWTSSAIGPGGLQKGRAGRNIFYGRLAEKPYEIEMPERNLVAQVSVLQQFDRLNDWRECPKDTIRIGEYLDKVSQSKSVSEGCLSQRLKEKGIPFFSFNEPEGIYVHLYSALHPEPRAGGSTTYDSEPHRSLIVGDAAVRHYLSKQDLEVQIQKTKRRLPRRFSSPESLS